MKLPCHLEADGLEDAEHVPVAGTCHEGLDADGPARLGQLFEQARADAAALMCVRHREGRLGERRVAQAHVVGNRDDALAVVFGKRREQGATLVPVGLEQRLDELLADLREAVEAAVEALF